MDIRRRLKIDQSVDVVLGCKPWDQLLFVLVNSSLKIVRDADIEIPRAARKDVEMYCFIAFSITSLNKAAYESRFFVALLLIRMTA